MGTAEQRFTRSDFLRMLDVTEQQLRYWERLCLISPRKGPHKYYDFRDLISLRTAKQLIEKGVPANRLRRSLAALQHKLEEVQTPLTELRILSDGRDVIVEREGARIEPLSGQFVLNFETRELREKVRVIPQPTAEEWFVLGVEQETNPDSREDAMASYQRAVALDPKHADALTNLGVLYYEQGDLAKASHYFESAAALGTNALAHFNLGSMLDELGRPEKARLHLREAVRIDPACADAHFNLAFVCDKLGAFTEAQQHWRAYVQLDPSPSSWNRYARQRLTRGGPSPLLIKK
jgi:tetratricopeptide (TPR) repeat protein